MRDSREASWIPNCPTSTTKSNNSATKTTKNASVAKSQSMKVPQASALARPSRKLANRQKIISDNLKKTKTINSFKIHNIKVKIFYYI